MGQYVLVILLTFILLVIPISFGDSQNSFVIMSLQNRIPEFSTPPTLNDTTPQTDDLIFCSNGTYYDFNNDSFGGQEWRWKDNGGVIGSADSQVLNLSIALLDKGDNITCESRVNDTFIWSLWTPTNNTAIIANTPPVISNPTISPDPAFSSSTLTCNWTYYDTDNDTQNESIIYWYVNNVSVKIENYTGIWPTLSSSFFTRGQEVLCGILGYDGDNYSTAYANTYQNITNTPPTFDSVTLVPDPAQKANTLTCSVNSRADIDGDSMTNYYRFLDTNVSVVLQNWSTDTTMDCEFEANCQKGDNITCEAYVSDGLANTSILNDTVSIGNTAPEAQSVYIYPFSPDTAFDLDCRHTFYDIDNDASAGAYYKWYLNDTETTNTTRFLNQTYLSESDSWRCSVRVYDGSENSSWENSSTVTIGATNPSNIIISNDGPVDEGNNITFTWYWDDPNLPFGGPYLHYVCNSSNITIDGCADTQWCFVNDSSSPTTCNFYANASLPSDNTLYIIVIDGTNQTSPIEPDIWVLNHRPYAANITVNVTSSGTFNTFTCSLSGENDSDGDSVLVEYGFFSANGTTLQSFSGTNTYIVNTGEGVHGDNISCRGRVYDDRIYSDLYNASDTFRIYDLGYSSPIVVDQYMTIYVKVRNTSNVSYINGVNISFQNSLSVLFSDLEMVYNSTNDRWEYIFGPNLIGEWTVTKIFTNQADGQGYYFLGQNDIFDVAATTPTIPEEPGGGGGGGATIKEVPIIGNITGFCGDKICQAGENPTNCFEDCRVDYDSLITCIWDKDIECNYEQAWFVWFLIIGLASIGVISIYFTEVKGKKNKKGRKK